MAKHTEVSIPPMEDAENARYYKMVLPPMSNKMTRFIAKYLRCLVHSNVRQLFHRYRESAHTENGRQNRRLLNIQLLGVYGLREGRKHLDILCDQLRQCINAQPWKSQLPQERLNIIADAIRYIFSAYNHKDYDAMMDEYEALQKAGRLQSRTYYSLGFPRMITKPSDNPKTQNKQAKKQAKIHRSHQNNKNPTKKQAKNVKSAENRSARNINKPSN